MAISIGSAVFAGLIVVTNRPTDHATLSLGIDRIYVVRAMRPKTGELPRRLFFDIVIIPQNSVYTQ